MKSLIYLIAPLLINFNLAAAEGVLMLAGGGPEGDIGVTTDWSYPLYKKLIENGDTNGDKKIKVVVVSLEKPDTNFMVDYLKSMGADSSENLVITKRSEANNPKLIKTLKDADVIFFRGGNQGHAYQEWKNTLLHKEIINLANRNGAIGGTSSGTMALAQYSITGGKDFSSAEVLQNAHSDLLNDEIHKKQSGIHNDFLNLADNLILDTHCGERARVGRLMAVMAKTTDDFQDNKILGLCLEEKTGVVISKGKATVYGTGLAHFMGETNETQKDRRPGHSLSYTDVRLDSLTEGWTFDLNKRAPITETLPSSAIKLDYQLGCGETKSNFKFKGSESLDLTFQRPEGTHSVVIANDAYSERKIASGDKKKGAVQTRAFIELAKDPKASVLLVDGESTVKSVDDNLIKTFGKAKVPTMVLDCSTCTFTSESSFISTQDDGSSTLKSKGFVNMRVHVLGEEAVYDVNDHKAMLVTTTRDADGGCRIVAPMKIESLADKEKKIFKKISCGK